MDGEPLPKPKELGPYQLGPLLGEGGMGKVYKAFDTRLRRWVAVKSLHGDAPREARERFQREAFTLAQLGHPSIVQIFDFVEDADSDWIVMELIDGPTLAESCLAGPLNVGLALDYARQIGSALEAAHDNGIIHRDLKTENVMVLPSGHVKVLDFGLALRVTALSSDPAVAEGAAALEEPLFSQSGRIVGTPRAMAPEQAMGRAVDERSDLFSLGVLLYELLAARPAFKAKTAQETLQQVLTHDPPALWQLNPAVPQRLSDLLDRLLEKDPLYRPQNAALVRDELIAIATGETVPSTSSGASQRDTLDSGELVDSSFELDASRAVPPAEHEVIYAELVIGLRKLEAQSYEVELRFTHPTSDTELPPARSVIHLDLEQLDALAAQPQSDASYGSALTRSLFTSPEVLRLYTQACAAAQAAALVLRVRLSIEAAAAELWSLHWELLEDPYRSRRLISLENVLFSRFVTSLDHRPIRLRPKMRLNALLAIAAPRAHPAGDSAFDAAEEIRYAEQALAEIPHEIVGRAGPLTLETLTEHLRAGIDILYLVAHPVTARYRETALCLQQEDSSEALVSVRDLSAQLTRLERPPRLVILRAGRGEGAGQALAAVAAQLATTVFGALLAVSGEVSTQFLAQALPVFFRELLKDGQVDRALACARVAAPDHPEILILYLRVKRGRIWYQPGFAGRESEISSWRSLTGSVRQQRFVPILGPDVCEHLFGSIRERAQGLAEEYSFPLAPHQSTDLAKVAQYLSVDESPIEARDAVLRQFHREALRRASDLSEEERELSLGKLLDVLSDRQLHADAIPTPIRVLVDLAAPLYINAGLDPLLLKALKASGRSPELLATDWHPTAENHPTEPASVDPSALEPVVYQPFGIFGRWESLVLTEDDFLDFLIASSTYKLMPRVVASTLTESTLIFLGFPLEDWAFRVLFRMIMNLNAAARLDRHAHVGVQVDPEEYGPRDVERTRSYLTRYFGATPRIDIYWGSSADFLQELSEQLAKAQEDDLTLGQVVEVDEQWL
ncbi:MAG: protein kinase [Acidobacteriota bacterium]